MSRRRALIGVLNSGTPYSNMLPNGDFEQGAIGWDLASATIVDSGGYTGNRYMNVPADYAGLSKIVTMPANHKFYVAFFAKVFGTRTSQVAWVTLKQANNTTSGSYTPALTGANNTWAKFSSIITPTAECVKFSLSSYRQAGAADPLLNVGFDGVMMVDLTATFGAGLEPTKAWCDTNLPFVVSSGTVQI